MNLPARWPAVVKTIDRARREIRVSIPGITDGAETLPIAEIEYPIGDKSEHTEIRVKVADRVWVAFEGGDARYPIITGFRTKHIGNEVGTRRFEHDNFEFQADDDFLVGAGQDVTHLAGRDVHASAGRHMLLEAADRMALEAGTELELKVGGSTITLTPSAIVFVTATETHTVPLATFSALVQIAGLLSANGGLAAIPGAGGGPAASIAGDVAITGSGGLSVATGDIVATAGDVKAGSVGLKTHNHANPEGGVVGPATG